MAETLANGTTVPQGSDPIHGSGVQAMRNLGGSVDGQLGARYTKAQADALLAGKAASSHTHPVSQVTGLQAALDAKAGSTDPRLSDARTPLPHGHALSDVTGLEARLTALEASSYDSGERNITDSVNPDEGMSAGSVYLRRVGKFVQFSMDALVFPAVDPRISIVRLGQPLFPAGFRPARTTFFPYAKRDQDENHGDVRVDGNGYVYLYQVAPSNNRPGETAYYRASGVFVTDNALPTILPGTPA